MSSITIVWLSWELFFQEHFFLLKGRKRKQQQINCLHETTQEIACCILSGDNILQNGLSFFFFIPLNLDCEKLVISVSVGWSNSPFHRDSLFVPWPLLCYQVHPGSPQNIVCFQFGFSLFIELDFFLIINVIHKHIYYSSAEAPNTRGRGRRVALPSPGRGKVC